MKKRHSCFDCVWLEFALSDSVTNKAMCLVREGIADRIARFPLESTDCKKFRYESRQRATVPLDFFD